MSENQEMQHHATISKSGEIDFPLWVKALAWVIGLCIPIAFAVVIWGGNLMWSMNDRMTRMEAKLETAASNRINEGQLLQFQIERNTRDIDQMKERLGMAGQNSRRAEPTN